MASKKESKGKFQSRWKNVIIPLIGTGGIGAIIIALLNHGGGHNVTTGNVSGNVAIGDHATIQISNISSISNQSDIKKASSSLTPKQIKDEIRSTRPAAREAFLKTYEGASVDWTLHLFSINEIDTDTNTIVVGLVDSDRFGSMNVVTVSMAKSNLAELNLLPNDAIVRVRGTIFNANELSVRLYKATITADQ
jgi:hypothetical protein